MCECATWSEVLVNVSTTAALHYITAKGANPNTVGRGEAQSSKHEGHWPQGKAKARGQRGKYLREEANPPGACELQNPGPQGPECSHFTNPVDRYPRQGPSPSRPATTIPSTQPPLAPSEPPDARRWKWRGDPLEAQPVRHQLIN